MKTSNKILIAYLAVCLVGLTLTIAAVALF